MEEKKGGSTATETTYILEGQSKNQQAFGGEQQSPVASETSASDTRQLLEDENEGKDKSSLPLASFNYINSIIGSGVIGMPYAFREAGFGLGLVLLGLVAVITDYSLVLMVRAAHLSGTFNYQGVMRAAFGTPGFVLLSLLQFIYPFIAMVSYNVVVGDTVTKVLVRIMGMSPNSALAHRELVTFLATLLVTLPLCMQRDVARLARVSFLSLVFVALILVAIVVRAPALAPFVPPVEGSWRFYNSDVIPALGIMAFAFMCHHNTFLIYESMARASQRRWDFVTHISVGTSAIVALVFGVVGYATFTEWAQGDLLENYCWGDDLMNAARLVFSATILLTFPIEFFVARDVILSTLLANRELSRGLSVALTVVLVASTLLLSMTTDCLGIVLELNGILAAVPLAYLLPALSYCRLEEGPFFCWRKLPALGTALFGAVVAILGVVLLVLHFDTASECSHGAAMPYCSLPPTVNNTVVTPEWARLGHQT